MGNSNNENKVLNNRVLLGMSGGVDSSVAAYLLKKQGYEVIGAIMQVWQEDEYYQDMEGGCCSLSAVDDARRVAQRLDIPFYVFNFRDKFKEGVIDYFIDEYMEGRTPNPCIMCNKLIKYEYFMTKAKEIDCDYIATGHYAKVGKLNDRYLLVRADDSRKDQTYALYNATQEHLGHMLMPCGDYTKDEIRAIGKEIGLAVHNKKDSEEICFIPDNNHGEYIKRMREGQVKPGKFVDKNGKVLGEHKGIVFYTIGQRKGLGVAFGKPVYVTDIIPWNNQVVLGDEEDIFKTELLAKDINLIPFDVLNQAMRVKAKIRYSGTPCDATIYPVEDMRIKVIFDEKQRAMTKGQSVVFYDGNVVVGGGVIEKIL